MIRPIPSTIRLTAVSTANRLAEASTGVRSSAVMKITGAARPGKLACMAPARSGSWAGPVVL